MENKTGECCLCGGTFEMYGCNPAPLGEGKCCHTCDETRVIPARIAIATGCGLDKARAIGAALASLNVKKGTE